MDLTEQQFREDLKEQALACRWEKWHATRLIFADWLDDHDHPEAACARADWQLASKPIQLHNQKHPWCYRFQCPVREQTRPRGWSETHNANWLLGFAPCTLKLTRILFWITRDCYRADWTWVPNRHRGRWKKMDTEVHADLGFLRLFVPPDPPLPLLEYGH